MLQVITITKYAQGDGLYSGGKVVVMSYVKFPAQDINLVRGLENNQEDVNQAFFLIYTLGLIHVFTCHKEVKGCPEQSYSKRNHLHVTLISQNSQVLVEKTAASI